jgi:hypothetical protein
VKELVVAAIASIIVVGTLALGAPAADTYESTSSASRNAQSDRVSVIKVEGMT